MQHHGLLAQGDLEQPLGQAEVRFGAGSLSGASNSTPFATRTAADGSFKLEATTVADAEQFFPGTKPAELEAYFDAHFLDHARHVLVDPAAAPVMQALSQRGIAHAIVTNSTTPLARETVRGAALEPDLLVGASDVARAKPAPDMVLLACERLGVLPAQALLVVWLAGGLLALGPVAKLSEAAQTSTAVRTLNAVLPPPTEI